MTFEILSTLLSVAALLLGTGWLVAGPLMLKRWRCDANPVALVVGRRLGVVYLSVAVLYFWTRTTPSADLQTTLSLFAAFANALLACMGVLEFLKRRIGPGIFVSVAAEILFVVGYSQLLMKFTPI